VSVPQLLGAALSILRGRGLIVDHVPDDLGLAGVTIAATPYWNLRRARGEFKMV
jgi:hypothetical protein